MTSETAEFYKNKNIFITGGTGFLGIAIIEKLLRTTPDVIIFILHILTLIDPMKCMIRCIKKVWKNCSIFVFKISLKFAVETSGFDL